MACATSQKAGSSRTSPTTGNDDEPDLTSPAISLGMPDTSLLGSVATQMMGGDEVELQGMRLPFRRTSKQRLRTVTFTMEGRQYAAIEQNPHKPSRWGELARSGNQADQLKDVQSNRFVAVAVDGEAKEYGGGKRRGQQRWVLLRLLHFFSPQRREAFSYPSFQDLEPLNHRLQSLAAFWIHISLQVCVFASSLPAPLLV